MVFMNQLDLNLEQLQLEFSALPNGLHLVEQDVVYAIIFHLLNILRH